MTSVPYKGIPFIFCRNPPVFSFIKKCAQPVGVSPNVNYSTTPLVTKIILPKKAKVYNKPENTMTKSELRSWALRNKYR